MPESKPRPAPWSEAENLLIIADYFAMLAATGRAEKINKAATRRTLLPKLNQRSEASIEFKRCNISACLVALGRGWLAGYRPMDNYQQSFLLLVKKHLDGAAQQSV
jgi:hypothetical protein